MTVPAATQTALSARQEARTMPRRNRRAGQPAIPVADLGPAIRRQRGDVIEHFRPDPDDPQRGTVKGARVRVWYHVAWIEGLLSDEQHEAADRYLIRLEQAEGAIEGSPARAVGVRMPGHGGPTDRQVQALADLREADGVLGHDVRLVRQVVGFNCTPAIGEVAMVRAALQRLAEHWEM